MTGGFVEARDATGFAFSGGSTILDFPLVALCGSAGFAARVVLRSAFAAGSGGSGVGAGVGATKENSFQPGG